MYKLIRNNWAFVGTIFVFIVGMILLVGGLTAGCGKMLPPDTLAGFGLLTIAISWFISYVGELIFEDWKECD